VTELERVIQMSEEATEQVQQNAMEQLSELAMNQIKAEEKVAKLERELSYAKKYLDVVSKKLIPDLMLSSGLSEVKLATGQKITITKGLSVSYDKAISQGAMFAFLKEKKSDDLIKTSFNVGKLESDVLDKVIAFMNENLDSYETNMDIHSQTLGKFMRDLIGLNLKEEERAKQYADGKIMNIEELPSFITAFTYNTAKIK